MKFHLVYFLQNGVQPVNTQTVTQTPVNTHPIPIFKGQFETRDEALSNLTVIATEYVRCKQGTEQAAVCIQSGKTAEWIRSSVLKDGYYLIPGSATTTVASTTATVATASETTHIDLYQKYSVVGFLTTSYYINHIGFFGVCEADVDPFKTKPITVSSEQLTSAKPIFKELLGKLQSDNRGLRRVDSVRTAAVPKVPKPDNDDNDDVLQRRKRFTARIDTIIQSSNSRQELPIDEDSLDDWDDDFVMAPSTSAVVDMSKPPSYPPPIVPSTDASSRPLPPPPPLVAPDGLTIKQKSAMLQALLSSSPPKEIHADLPEVCDEQQQEQEEHQEHQEHQHQEQQPVDFGPFISAYGSYNERYSYDRNFDQCTRSFSDGDLHSKCKFD